ncbi:hypothetical protein EZS27_031627, partial [termite gut metagenome]
MITHYIKIAYRNLLRYKTQSIISILGLAAGFACFAFSALWEHYEATYDNFHEGAGRIYLIGTDWVTGFSPSSSYALAEHLKQNFPEIEAGCHLNISPNAITLNGMEYFIKEMRVDSNTISMFNIRLLEGNHNYSRKDSKEVAITPEAAKRIFGNESPIGKTISTKYPKGEKVVCAVVEGWNGHSALPFDILSSSLYDMRWGSGSGYTLIRIRKEVNSESFVQKLAGYEINLVEEYSQKGFVAKPLMSLRSEMFMQKKVSPEYVRLFALTGGLVILCGLLNYLMLFIIRIRLRGRELALRKVNGASGASLMKLLITEFGLILIISLLVGMLPIELLLPKFKELSQINESGRFFYKETFVYIFAVVAIAFLFSAFPIYYFRRRSLRTSIYGSEGGKRSAHLFRKTALVFQLIICICFVFF